jgi:curved DNA-binding protein CbpA
MCVVYAEALRFVNFARVGPRESASTVRERTPPISTSGAKRRSTRIVHIVPLIVSWLDSHGSTIVEETATVSINCHGFQYFSRQRPPKDASATFKIIANKKEDKPAAHPAYPGRIAWARKSRRLDGLFLVGMELGIPLNIWDVDEVPEDWAAFSPPTAEDPASFLIEVDRFLHFARTATYYQLLGVKSNSSRSELKRHFYQLARRFHPDHHMDRPEWTPRLVSLMEGLTTAYETLSDEGTKKEYDSLLAHASKADPSEARKQTQGYLDKAHECMAEKNFAGCILWLHRAIESEPNSSSHRTMLGRCLSAIPEYRREAVEQFEIAIDLDPRNLTAHLQYGELLEHLKLPGRARAHYLRVLQLDANQREARNRLIKMDIERPRSVSLPSLFGRLTGRRMR